ncbi:MAG: hypothetical protein A3D16_18955 [Rhodobacterales bacterium RIFCSPHIGHO2_02_FULL_62_130]|nr:MAG: hypothetical protein A3D16_18955 [Rhodobacterales bacterium RIFCSPHIGHO2_02_FULL_62_130]OHC58460.1 MAG: hypothetical protein A3E48_02025 [Rhodobacterales bacterium RIFCSPHIGHO2_12_FULL_62_75]
MCFLSPNEGRGFQTNMIAREARGSGDGRAVQTTGIQRGAQKIAMRGGIPCEKLLRMAHEVQAANDSDAAVLNAALPLGLVMRCVCGPSRMVMWGEFFILHSSYAMRTMRPAMICVSNTACPGRNDQDQADYPHQIRQDILHHVHCSAAPLSACQLAL